MSTAKLSTKGQLVFPVSLRKALNLNPGDKVDLTVEGHRLVLQGKAGVVKLSRGPGGRMVLTKSPRPKPITTEDVIALLEELP